MIQNRTARFWVLGLTLIAGNGFYIFYKLVKLHAGLSTPEMIFQGTIFLVGIMLFDAETGKDVFNSIVQVLAFWKKGTPPEGS